MKIRDAADYHYRTLKHPPLTRGQEVELGRTKDFHEYAVAHRQLIEEKIEENVENLLRRLNENHGTEFLKKKYRKKTDWFTKYRLKTLLIDYHKAKGNANPPKELQQLIDDAREHVENEDLEKTGRAALDARNKLITHHRRLSTKIAQKYYPPTKKEDLLQMGDEGLLIAATHYDYTQNNRFCGYARHWIKSSLTKGIEKQGKTVRLPADLLKQVSQYQRMVAEHLQKTGRPPTEKEAATKLGWTQKKIDKVMKHLKPSLELNKPIYAGEDSNEYADLLESKNNAEQIKRKIDSEKLIRTAKQGLNEREYHVIKHRFGLEGAEHKTFQELGDELGVSREAIRQTEAKILEKLGKIRAIRELK